MAKWRKHCNKCSYLGIAVKYLEWRWPVAWLHGLTCCPTLRLMLRSFWILSEDQLQISAGKQDVWLCLFKGDSWGQQVKCTSVASHLLLCAIQHNLWLSLSWEYLKALLSFSLVSAQLVVVVVLKLENRSVETELFAVGADRQGFAGALVPQHVIGK